MEGDQNNPGPLWLMGADGPVDLGGKVVGDHLPCLTCRYDLRGVAADGACPECGGDVADAVSWAIDPVRHRLPSIADPPAVGRGLVAAAAALVGATLLPLSGMLLHGLLHTANSPLAGSGLLYLGLLGGIVSALIGGSLACWCLRPRTGGPLEAASRKAVWLLGVGLGLIACAMGALLSGMGPGFNLAVVTGEGLQIWPGQAWRILAGVEGVGLGIVVALMGMRGVLVEAGNRSRLFRTARQGRQRIKPMHAANGLAMVVFACYMAARGGGTEDLALVIWLLWLIVCGMVAIGQLYLLVNAWWIRKDLLVPTPRLRELVKPG